MDQVAGKACFWEDIWQTAVYKTKSCLCAVRSCTLGAGSVDKQKDCFFFSCHSCYSPLNLHSSIFFLFCLYAISSLTLFSHLWAVHIGCRLIYLCLFYTSLVLQILVFPIWPPFLGKVKFHAIAAIGSLWSVGHSSEDWLVERDLGWTPGITEPNIPQLQTSTK